MKAEDYKTYVFSYHHNGAEWTITIKAESEDDAKERMRKLPLARYDGVLYATIPAGIPGAGWFVRLLCWWNNFWQARASE